MTPLSSTTLTQAMQDNSQNVIYLARPCQYLKADNCQQQPSAAADMQALQEAISFIAEQYPVPGIELISTNNSTINQQIAATRTDVLLVTSR